ncbi:MAG: LicD family protein, partial [Oscillospiraceae bacterium]|nr:LicD family protein [Oscillospiraceae bacterium]
DCSWIGTCMGAYYFHEFVPKKMFGKGSKIQFCDMEVNAPEQIDLYLRHMYGDYMTPPAEKEQKALHVKLYDDVGG